MATKSIPLDDTIKGCLRKIARCDTLAIGVLADHLDEIGHPFAKRLRKMWLRYQRRETYFMAKSFSRSNIWTRGLAIATDRMFLRAKVARLFRRQWVYKDAESFMT